MCPFFVQIFRQSQNVTKKRCLYEKFVRKMLMKLTSEISITQINSALLCTDTISYNDHGFKEQNYLTFSVPFGYLTTTCKAFRVVTMANKY